jgi:hypothetical protein
MVYVLGSILEPEFIVAVLGIIYASIRSAVLFQYFHDPANGLGK